MVRIALDAMGGDHAPLELVKGALQAVKELPLEVVLVGQEHKLKKELLRHPKADRISIVQASQIIETDEAPIQAIKQKKDSSIVVGISLLKEKKVDAFVSAGNTGALMAAALFGLGRIKGIERPAIAAIFPTPTKPVLLLDVGANADCKPKHLEQFAEMGSFYAEHVLNIKNPKVGLLNIGEEKEKGNELCQKTWPLLAQVPINFIGNVESKEIMAGKADVVICDGFVGNLVLKFAESVADTVFSLLKNELTKNIFNKSVALMLSPVFRKLKKTVSYDTYGGAPLLGVSGVVFKAHGRSKAPAIKNAIRVAAQAVNENMIDCLKKVEYKND